MKSNTYRESFETVHKRLYDSAYLSIEISVGAEAYNSAIRATYSKVDQATWDMTYHSTYRVLREITDGI